MPQYLPLGTVNAPATWTLPAGLELSVGAVFATFDGTGAAGSYIPTLQVVSDAGVTVLEVPQDASVAAGASVVASWAPFLRSQSTSGGGCSGNIDSTATAGATCGVHSVGAPQFRVLVADGSGGSAWTTIQSAEEIADNGGVSVGASATVSMSLTHQFGSTLLNYATNPTVKVTQRGMYGGYVTVQANGVAATRNRWQMFLETGQVSYAAAGSSLDIYSDALADVTTGTLPIAGFMAAGDHFIVKVLNLDTAARTFTVPVFRLERILTV